MNATEANGWTIYALPIRNRQCGTCQECCTIVPAELHHGTVKPANTRCPHQCSHGCGIYPTRPDPCRYWSCRWLFDEATAKLKRPDHGGYMVDPMLEDILLDGEPFHAVQVWVDPKRREAHRAPELRAYLQHVAERFSVLAIVRWSSTEGMLLAAPHFTDDGNWQEREQNAVTRAHVEAVVRAHQAKHTETT